MKLTKNILLSLILFGSASRMTANDQGGTDGLPHEATNSEISVPDELGITLILRAFASIAPSDSSFESAKQAFDRFLKKDDNKILALASNYFHSHADYCKALAKCAEQQKFPFLAALLYQRAESVLPGSDLTGKVKELGVASMVQLLHGIEVQPGFVLDPKVLFAASKKGEKSVIERANDIFKLVSNVFPNRNEFVKAVYEEIQANDPGRINVAQLFGNLFNQAK